MLTEKLEISGLRKLIPRKIQTLIRFYSIFNFKYGHSNFRNGFCVDGAGSPVPWLTYPCIEFLDNLDLKDCHVFEFGAGSSTLYWAQRVKSVTSVERDASWYNKILPYLPTNCVLKHCEDETLYPSTILESERRFDVIVVDGAVRYPCVEEALKRISAEGFLILDNTEWYPNVAQLLRKNDYIQIDFCGFPPINAFTSCTSIFYKSSSLFLRRKEKDKWRPLGAKYLVAHDDVPLAEIDASLLRRS